MIVDERDTDMTGWRIECRTYDGRTYISEFQRATWWLSGGEWWNGLGLGETRKPWSALCDHHDELVRWVPPGASALM
ncbi:hypothetical protein [Mycolicibacterium diernhoferi]|uniref:hypothetical protein n=1 Tax=Mycolicibacterium diernhoferi TaxID=1801 RepID=UPI001042108F|nr:hypothetical protein [Mycolicibacterium diernhoferi]QYL21042.1 hypothetical protein K0O62_18575 [Mycolicibacterium diernhoferi]